MALELTLDNYYSQDANKEYMSASQFKDFLKCPKYALAKINGEYVEEKSKAMLVGGYVDAYFSNRLEQYKLENPQIFKKDGTLLKDFEKANEIIKVIEEDDFFKKHIQGDTQVIITGEIAGVPFKGALDFLNERIVDLKCVASIQEKVWVERDGKNIKTDFIDAYDYDLQLAIYQELVRQKYGLILPTDIACVSKEDNPDKAIINVEDEFLKPKLDLAKELAPTFNEMKKGNIKPYGCGNCPVCRKYNKLNHIMSYKAMKGIDDNVSQED